MPRVLSHFLPNSPPPSAPRLRFFVAISVLFHIVCLGGWLFWHNKQDLTASWQVKSREIPRNKAFRVRKLARTQHAKTPAKPIPEIKNEKGQIVDLPKPKEEKEPQTARFLSSYNTTVEREQRARKQDPKFKNAANMPTTVAGKQAQAKEQKHHSKDQKRAVTKQKIYQKNQEAETSRNTQQKMTLRNRARRNLELKVDWSRLQSQTWRNPSQQSSSLPPTQPGLPDIFPSKKTGTTVGSPPNDSLQDVDIGDGTFLNSKEFKYAFFFNRLKRSVSQYWAPLPPLQARDPTGAIYGGRHRLTVVQVALYANGELKSLRVSRSSGVPFLDAVATRALRDASPFPNPPKGLADADAMIRFPFAFDLDLTQGGLQLRF